MRHICLPSHLRHIRSIGIPIPPISLDIPANEYNESYSAWKRTLPNARHEELHKRVLAHAAWKRHVTNPEEKKMIRWERITIIVLLLLLYLLLFFGKAHAQFSHISSIQIQQAGSTISGGFITYPFSLNFNTNLTVSCSGGVCTINATGGSGTGCVPGGTAGRFLIDSGTGTCNDFGGFAASAHNFVTGLNSAGTFQAAQPAFTDISGSWAVGQAPASANSCSTHQFTISLASGFNVTCAQPVAADIGSIPGTSGQLLFNNAGAIGAEDPVISYNNPSETTAAWTSATANNTVLSITLPVGSGVLSTVMVTLNQGSTITGGAVSFLASDTTGLTNTYPVYCIPQGAQTGPISSYTLTATVNASFQCSLASFEAFEVKLSPAISGTGTVNIGIQPTSAPSQAQVAVVNFPATQAVSGTVTAQQATAANLNATIVGTGTLAVQNTQQGTASQNVAQFGGVNVSTGTGASGTGIPRVTVSNDSSLAANQSVNVNQIAGAASSASNPLFVEPTDGTNAMGAMANYGTAPGAVKALNANVAVTNTPNVAVTSNSAQCALGTCATQTAQLPESTSTYAATPYEVDALTTAAAVKGSAGNVYGWYVYNPNASTCFLEIFNTASPTLGTTAPILSLGIPATGAANIPPGSIAVANFSTAIEVAATTASKGASTCGTGMTVNIWYQ